jgi:catechol 2,3-dioxygenase-like lactoylglutathione lyase family enzyme
VNERDRLSLLELLEFSDFSSRFSGVDRKGTSVLDHVSVGVTNIDRSRSFYDAALRPLGLVRIVDFGEGRGSDYGAAPGSLGVEFTITNEAEIKTPIPGAHLCFRAPDRKAVDGFYAAALAAGGRDDGAPGLRPHYHADYYCAFVLDPDGHRIEAVCHAPKRPVILAAGRALSRKVKHLTFSDMTIVGSLLFFTFEIARRPKCFTSVPAGRAAGGRVDR